MRHKKRLLYEGFITICPDPLEDYSHDTVILTSEKMPQGMAKFPESAWTTETKPLSELLENEIKGATVTVQFWMSDEKISQAQVKQEYLEQVLGLAEVEYRHHYSDITGYLYTDEELKIGGHDLLEMLTAHHGKYLILEIFVH